MKVSAPESFTFISDFNVGIVSVELEVEFKEEFILLANELLSLEYPEVSYTSGMFSIFCPNTGNAKNKSNQKAKNLLIGNCLVK
jgi:hypothetical protein